MEVVNDIGSFVLLAGTAGVSAAQGQGQGNQPTAVTLEAQPTIVVFGSAATHVHDSCGSGDPIFVHGLERTESWPDKETGEKRTKDVVVVDNRFGEVGISLKYVSARIDRAPHAAQAS